MAGFFRTGVAENIEYAKPLCPHERYEIITKKSL